MWKPEPTEMFDPSLPQRIRKAFINCEMDDLLWVDGETSQASVERSGIQRYGCNSDAIPVCMAADLEVGECVYRGEELGKVRSQPLILGRV